jgi:uncharacterized protein
MGENGRGNIMTLDALCGEKRAEILRLAQLHGAYHVQVFGSVARGDNRENSDVDFLVEFEAGRSLLDLIALKLDLQDLLGTSVDIVTPNSLRYLREHVLAEARAL